MTPLLLCALLVFVLTLVHASIVNGWRTAFAKLKDAPGKAAIEGGPPLITVIVPARNAAATLVPLLQDLYAQSHPRDSTEVIVVDDHSEDTTAAIARSMMPRWLQLRVITLGGEEGKKAAITEGVRHAKGDLILISDADVRCGPDRLKTLAAHWGATGAGMILMPVHTNGEGVPGAIQEEEQLAFLGAAAGSAADGAPLLANGANMAFSKAAFGTVGGYAGDRWASGDDLFLLARMKRAGKRIEFLLHRDVVVEVEAERTWRGFLSQRLRWAGKMRTVSGWGMLAGAFGVLMPWILIALSLLAAPEISLVKGWRLGAVILAGWLFWIVPVVGLINEVKRFLGIRNRAIRSLLSLLAFPIYALPVAVASLFVRPRWKGR